jgi:hypothetical protein
LVFQKYEDADKMDKLMDRQALLQDKIDALGAWEIDTKLEIAMDAVLLMQILNKELVWRERRRVALCRLYFSNLMFYYWMSLPITWMQKAVVRTTAQYSGTVIAVTR